MAYLEAAFKLGGSTVWFLFGFFLGAYCRRNRGEGDIETFGTFAVMSAVPASVLFTDMPNEGHYAGAFWVLSMVALIGGYVWAKPAATHS